jgi:hypothetical protein
VALLAGLASAATASATTRPDVDTTVTWQAAGSGGRAGDYLGIVESGTANGNWANTYPWTGANNQKWYSVLKGTGEYAFENVNSGKCLEDHGWSYSTQVDQWACGSFPDNLLWQEYYYGGAYQLENQGLIDQYGSGAIDACADASDQWLHFYNVENGYGADCEWH